MGIAHLVKLKGNLTGLFGPGPIIVSIMEMAVEARDRRGTSDAFAITAIAISITAVTTMATFALPMGWIWRVV